MERFLKRYEDYKLV